jgi:Flp pilus assembly pilin Flp
LVRPSQVARRFCREDSGAELTEFALVLPVFLLVILASMQIAFIGVVHYEVKYLARETARWLAVNPDTIDGTTLANVKAQVLPGMSSSGVTSSSLSVSPPCSALDYGGHCANRPSGAEITVSLTYDASSDYFLPPSLFGFSMASKTVGSQVSILVE